MTANVVCTGRRPDPNHPGGYMLTACAIGTRKPWKGTRTPFGHLDDKTLRYGPNLTLPCPRCGGTVQLISQVER
jgi:hypothetical protein